MINEQDQPDHNPNLIGLGLLAAGSGLLLFVLIGFAWTWFRHK